MTNPHHTSVPQVLVPQGWQQIEKPASGVPLVMVSPEPGPSGHPPSVAIGVERVDDPDPTAYLERLGDDLREVLEDVTVNDESFGEFYGRDVAYLQAAHWSDGFHMKLEIWSWLVDGLAWSVSAHVDLADHERLADLLTAVAATFVPPDLSRGANEAPPEFGPHGLAPR